MSIACDDLIDLIAASDSPNLYWALASIPQPPINYRRSFEYEQTLPERYTPWLVESDAPTRTPDDWRTLFRTTVRDIVHDANLDAIPIHDGSPDWHVDLVTAALIARNYPSCKRDLIQWGHPPESVEQMSVGQVVALHQQAVYHHVAQHTAKWTLLPHALSGERDHQEQQRLEEEGWWTSGWGGRESIPIVTSLMPALLAAREAEARSEVRPMALMVVEALRMHAWENEGRLPDSLDEITIVPVPENPATGQPFPYRLDGETASLDVATTLDPADSNWYWRVELRIDPDWAPPGEQ